MSNPETTLSALRFLAATYEHRWKPTADQLAAWAVLLADIKPDDLKRAAVQHAQVSQHPPTVAELRKLALPDITPSGDEAFDLARRAAHSASRYDERSSTTARKALELKDPIAAQACSAFGGFQAFWDMLSEDLPANRAQFRNIYDSMQRRAKTQKSSAEAQQFLDRITTRNDALHSGPRKLLDR